MGNSNFPGGLPETKSGVDSTLTRTAQVRAFVERVVEDFRIESICDVGCGDFNWMSHVNLGDAQYRGYDIAYFDEWERHRSAQRQFIVENPIADIAHCQLALCRDVMPHLEDGEVLRLLNMIRRRASFLLATTFTYQPSTRTLRGSIPFAPLDLTSSPWGLSKPLDCVEEPQPHKYLALFSLS